MREGLRRMFEMRQQYDEVCERAAQFKTEESHLQDLEQRLRELLAGGLSSEWVQRPDGNFESKLVRKNNE